MRTPIRRGARGCALVTLLSALLAQPVWADTLRAGSSGDYPPFSRRDAQGELSGFDVVVARRLAADLAMEISFVAFQWPNLMHDLQQGTFDIAMSGVTVRADRALAVDFTRPYASGGAVIVVRKEEAARFATVQDANRKGVRIAVNAGGHLERVARQHFADAALLPTADNPALPMLLRDKTVDAVVSDSFEAGAWDNRDLIIRGPFTHDRKAYAVRRGGGELLRQVNDWLLARESDGWLDQQRQLHLGEAGQLTPADATIEALVGAISLRLQMMPYVAAVKRRARLPVEDAAQEKRVLGSAAAAAASAGLNPQDVAELFESMITAAKSVEHGAADVALPSTLKLADLRRIIGSIGDQIIAELRRSAALSKTKGFRQRLADALRTELGNSKLAPDLIQKIADDAGKVRLL